MPGRVDWRQSSRFGRSGARDLDRVALTRRPLLTGAAVGARTLRWSRSPRGDELRAPLWWPPAKIAGRLLVPYLARRIDPSLRDEELLDLPIEERRESDHHEARELALRWADLDAGSNDLRRALHWLDVAEGLELALPESYEAKRGEWRRRLGTE